MIVTTPEKWDVITRKTSDMALAVLVKLLIIDEVHLLNDDRGPVIETIVARTLRQVWLFLQTTIKYLQMPFKFAMVDAPLDSTTHFLEKIPCAELVVCIELEVDSNRWRRPKV